MTTPAPAPAAPTPPVRRARTRIATLAWLLATALPILLLATAASYLLIRFLAARDRFGPRHLTITDDTGAVLAHADLTLAAGTWGTSWSRSAPYLTFYADFTPTSGTLSWNDAGARRVYAAGLTPDGWTWTIPRQGGTFVGVDLGPQPGYPDHSGWITLDLTTNTGTGGITAGITTGMDHVGPDACMTFHATLTR